MTNSYSDIVKTFAIPGKVKARRALESRLARYRVRYKAIPLAVSGPVPPPERTSPVLKPFTTLLGAVFPFAEFRFV